MTSNEIKKAYFAWLSYIAMPYAHSYNNLLQALFATEFMPSMERDVNRSIDGLNLRVKFANDNNIDSARIDTALNRDCTMLEMMLALAIRMEESIMSDPSIGNRTSYWFTNMLYSLRVMQPDQDFDIDWFNTCIYEFNTRQYQPNGFGSLFTINDPTKDMRNYELWFQMNFYLVEVDHNSEHISI